MGFMVNAQRMLANIFPDYFTSAPKHNHYADFGYPTALVFDNFYQLWRRNSFANAAISRYVEKTWEENPTFRNDPNPDALNSVEQEVADHFKTIRFWQRLAQADRMSLVGGYSGLILRVADNQTLSQPVARSNGIEGIAGVVPIWKNQITVQKWDQDPTSETYNQPLMFQVTELPIDGQTSSRTVEIHPDRLVIWSEDGTMNSNSLLEPCYNDLLTIEKVMGAGGEGFWKNARSSPVIEVDPDAKLESLAKSLGVTTDKLGDKINEVVEDWQAGFDKMLMLQGMKLEQKGITLPQPGEFVDGPLQAVAASLSIPLKVLVGNQTGERASTEDAQDWARVITSRRINETTPLINEIARRFIMWGVLPKADWFPMWNDLTEARPSEKVDRASKLSSINREHVASGGDQLIFTPDEIRAAVGYKPIGESNAQ